MKRIVDEETLKRALAVLLANAPTWESETVFEAINVNGIPDDLIDQVISNSESVGILQMVVYDLALDQLEKWGAL